MGRTSIFEKYLRLPENDPERIEFESRQWIGGDDVVCRWQLSVLTQEDVWSVSFEQYQERLSKYLGQRLSPISVKACMRSGEAFARIYLEHLRRQRGNAPALESPNKEQQAVLLLLENPDLNDLDVAQRVPTTLKQLERFTTYGYLRRELRLAATDIKG